MDSRKLKRRKEEKEKRRISQLQNNTVVDFSLIQTGLLFIMKI